MEVKQASTPAPGGEFSVLVEETEKWMEEAMQMVSSLGGGRRGWELPTVLIPTLSFEQTSRVLSHHHSLDGVHAL